MSRQLLPATLCLVAITLAVPTPNLRNPVDENGEKLVIPAMARKAGGRWKPELLKAADSSHEESTTSLPTPTVGNDHWEDSGSEEEEECPRRQFFHIRGKQCVPIRCDTKRDPNTGLCEETQYPYRSYFSRGSGHARTYPVVYIAGGVNFSEGITTSLEAKPSVANLDSLTLLDLSLMKWSELF